MLSRLLGGVVIFIAFVVLNSCLVAAQTTSATCMPSFNWASNSRKQSPCAVASSLLSTCSDQPYNVDALPENSHYTGPSLATANSCQCSTVVYSLLSACGECQNRTIELWSTWATNCPHVDISTFTQPIPSGTKVPGWAYMDVKVHDLFDVELARTNANSTSYTESSAAPPRPTSSSVAQVSAPASTTTSSAIPSVSALPASEDDTSPVGSTKNDEIIGGVIGGVLGLFVLGALALWFFRRQRMATSDGQLLESPTMSQTNADTIPSRRNLAAEVPSKPGSPDIFIRVESADVRQHDMPASQAV